MGKHVTFRSRFRLALLMAALSFFTGCASIPKPGQVVSAVNTYFFNRRQDALDIFEVGIVYAYHKDIPCFRLDVKYGLGMFGSGASGMARTVRLGQRSWHPEVFWGEMAPVPFPAGVPMLLALYPFGVVKGEDNWNLWALAILIGLEEEGEESGPPWGGPGSWETNYEVHKRIAGVAYKTEWGAGRQRILWGKSFPIGAEFVPFLGGARARLYPVEVLDFLTGLVGWDMLGDDNQ